MKNDAEFTIEAIYGSNWEPVPEGDFRSLEEASAAMRELEAGLGWRGLRIVDSERTVWEYGLERQSLDEDEDEGGAVGVHHQ